MDKTQELIAKYYHLGISRCAHRLGVSEEELRRIAAPRIVEYWDIAVRTASYERLIERFSELCDELNLTEASALITLNRRFRK